MPTAALPSTPKDGRVYFELVFQPSAILTTVVRRFIRDFYERIIGNDDSVARLALATHELLENAVKYGIPNEATTLSVELDQNAGIVSIQTNNRSNVEHIDVLRRRFADMKAAPDGFQFYQQLLRATAREASVSGLGLARIRCEGEMDVDLEVDGDRVRISAVARTHSEAAS